MDCISVPPSGTNGIRQQLSFHPAANRPAPMLGTNQLSPRMVPNQQQVLRPQQIQLPPHQQQQPNLMVAPHPNFDPRFVQQFQQQNVVQPKYGCTKNQFGCMHTKFNFSYSPAATGFRHQQPPQQNVYAQQPVQPPVESPSTPISMHADFDPSSAACGSGTDSKSALDRWESDEPLGDRATTAAVLYTNVHHPDLKVSSDLQILNTKLFCSLFDCKVIFWI